MALNLKNLHILLIEDIAPLRELTISVLKAQGVGKISYANDGEKGFEAYCRFNPDIIITDWQMPGMDGIDLVKLIRNNPRSQNKTIPIIMMTGFGSPLRISSARDCGVTEFLIKPFSAKDLSKRITHVIANPRDFIVAENYVGPDRRRKKDDSTDSQGCKRGANVGLKQKIKASTLLQSKVGMGLMDEDAINKSQSLIDKNKFDFVPIATGFIEELKKAIDIAKAEKETNRKSIERMIDPVMQVKANARIFKYDLLGNLAGIMLHFLEYMNELDNDAIQIVEAHQKTLHAILINHMEGSGGDMGHSLEEELEAACKRYMNTRISRQKERLQQALTG